MIKEFRTLTVIAEDRSGLMTEMTELLAEHQMTLHDFSGDVVGSSAVFKLVPVDYEGAYKVLQEAGYQLIAHRSVLVCMEDKPGALARLSRRLSDADIEIRGIHIVGHQGDSSLVALEVNDSEDARATLEDILV